MVDVTVIINIQQNIKLLAVRFLPFWEQVAFTTLDHR